MPNMVYLNGAILPSEEARISVFDHGFLYGDGIFETMRSYEGKVFKLEEHLNRLRTSASLLQILLPWTNGELKQAISMTLEANQLLKGDAYIRLSVSRGEGPLGIDPELCPNPTIVIMVKKLLAYSEEIYGRGQKVIFVKTKRNSIEALNPAIKSFNFLNNILAKIEVKAAKVSEGLMLNHEGFVAEGTISNVFFVKGGVLFTPSIKVGILEGITRNTVIKIAAELGYKIVEAEFYPDDLYTAEEVFLTNSSGELMPVNQIDQTVVGNGKPGELTLRLLDEYRQRVR